MPCESVSRRQEPRQIIRHKLLLQHTRRTAPDFAMGINVTGIPFVAYPVTDLERAKDFYERIIGLECTMDHPLGDGMRWIEFDIGQTGIAISNMMPRCGSMARTPTSRSGSLPW